MSNMAIIAMTSKYSHVLSKQYHIDSIEPLEWFKIHVINISLVNNSFKNNPCFMRFTFYWKVG